MISVWIPGDQLLLRHPALAAAEEVASRGEVSVLLVESAARLQKLPYQRKKLVLLLSALRHYAEELRAEGYHVDYIQASSAVAGLREHQARVNPSQLLTMATAEYRGRKLQQERLTALLGIPITVLANTQMLLGRYNPFPEPGARVVMETFYRAMRRHFDLLLDPSGGPEGGAWNFDKQNRQPLPKGMKHFPPLPAFAPDSITRKVMAEVASLPRTVGSEEGFNLAVTRADAQAAGDEFIARRLPQFGPYEDAMTVHSTALFHSLLSPYLNIGLLDPLDLARAAERAYRQGLAPLNSVEGFIRQIVGWREYIYWQYWQQMPGLLDANFWGQQGAMPTFFWTGDTEMNCLRHAISRVLAEGYSHHIERLMLICNYCLLLGVDPFQVHAWFLACYVDAYEWVVAPNVIGMGLNADGGRTGTKPYIASANYINKMSDYCQGCRFHPKQRTGADACPFNYLYWDFLIEHEDRLRANPRLGPAVLGLARLDDAQRAEVRRLADEWRRNTQRAYRG
jgi:deoxyribodipyrimidine photolyase-related protein